VIGKLAPSLRGSKSYITMFHDAQLHALRRI